MNTTYIKQLLLFFFTVFCILLCWEFLVFNEEIILLIASFIMFNLFIQLCFNVLTEILVVRTNEIYFLFYDLFVLKLEKLELYKLNIIRKLNINKQLMEILQILKINLYYLNLIQSIYNFAFLNYLLYSLLENIIFEEFKFLKLFLQKKLINLDTKTLKNNNIFFNNVLKIRDSKINFFKNLQVIKLDINLLKFVANRLIISKWYFYNLYTQVLNKNNKFILTNNINYIESLVLFFQNNQTNLYLSNNLYFNFKLKLYYELQLTNQVLKVSELNTTLSLIK